MLPTAILSPSHPSIRHNGGRYRELNVVERLSLSLPDGIEVSHSIGWHTVSEAGKDRHGEIDVAMLSQAGQLLLVEVKAG